MKTLRLTVNPAQTCDPVGVDTAAQASISEAFGLIVRFTLRQGHERRFDDLAATTVDEIAQYEPGTLLYVSHTVDDEPRTRIFYELYRDQAAFKAHEHQPHVRHFLAAREAHVESFEVDRLSPLAYAGIGGAES
jgi:quinol monooxygenase YgiN